MNVVPGGIDHETARADGVALRVAVRRCDLRHERRGGAVGALGADRRAIGKEGLLVIGKTLQNADFKDAAREGRRATPGGRGCRANVEIPDIGKTARKFKRAIAGTAVQTVVNRSHRKFVDDCERAAAHAHGAVRRVAVRHAEDALAPRVHVKGVSAEIEEGRFVVGVDESKRMSGIENGVRRQRQ